MIFGVSYNDFSESYLVPQVYVRRVNHHHYSPPRLLVCLYGVGRVKPLPNGRRLHRHRYPA